MTYGVAVDLTGRVPYYSRQVKLGTCDGSLEDFIGQVIPDIPSVPSSFSEETSPGSMSSSSSTAITTSESSTCHGGADLSVCEQVGPNKLSTDPVPAFGDCEALGKDKDQKCPEADEKARLRVEMTMRRKLTADEKGRLRVQQTKLQELKAVMEAPRQSQGKDFDRPTAGTGHAPQDADADLEGWTFL